MAGIGEHRRALKSIAIHANTDFASYDKFILTKIPFAANHRWPYGGLAQTWVWVPFGFAAHSYATNPKPYASLQDWDHQKKSTFSKWLLTFVVKQNSQYRPQPDDSCDDPTARRWVSARIGRTFALILNLVFRCHYRMIYSIDLIFLYFYFIES